MTDKRKTGHLYCILTIKSKKMENEIRFEDNKRQRICMAYNHSEEQSKSGAIDRGCHDVLKNGDASKKGTKLVK